MPLDDPRELFYLVDQTDHLLGSISRRQAHSDKNNIHRSIFILIDNSRRELLLQKRSSNKDTYPGFWTVSASGHVTYGQSYSAAAARELHEELGLSLPLTLLKKTLIVMPNEQEYAAIFQAATEQTPLNFDPSEISQLRWVSPQTLRRLAAHRQLTPGAIAVLKSLHRLP